MKTQSPAMNPRPHSRFSYVRIPFYRRHAFVFTMAAILAVWWLWLLPPRGVPSTPQGANIVVFFFLCTAWVGNLIMDREKPEWLQSLVAGILIVLVGWMIYMYSGTDWERLIRFFFNYNKMRGNWRFILTALTATFKLAVFGAMLSLAVGVIVAVLRSLENKILGFFLVGYVDFFRAIPLVVLMVLVYYALPYLGIAFNSLTAGVISLGLYWSAYVSEVVRAGILAIHRGQIEAASSLGMSTLKMMRLVILPQAVRIVIPPLANSYVSLVKDTAIASIIAVPELLKKGQDLMVSLANPTPLIVVGIIYLLFLLPMVRVLHILEGRMKPWVKR